MNYLPLNCLFQILFAKAPNFLGATFGDKIEKGLEVGDVLKESSRFSLLDIFPTTIQDIFFFTLLGCRIFRTIFLEVPMLMTKITFERNTLTVNLMSVFIFFLVSN